MFTKALWLRNYKQSKFVIWGFWLACLYFPYKIYSHIKSEEYSLLHWEEWGNSEPYQYYFGNFIEVGFFQILLLIVLATILIGLERTTQSLDFTLSLPYKRKDIFFAKWAIGVVNIIAALSISVLISIYILMNSVIHEYLPVEALGYYFVVALSTLIGVYTFSLFMGFIGASVVSQFVFSVIFLALPYGLYNLVLEGFSYHYYGITGTYFDRGIYGLYDLDRVFEYLSFPILLLDFERDINEIFIWQQDSVMKLGISILFPITITVISLYFITLLSNNLKSENNGKILAYEKLFPFLRVGVLICFYFFGGMVVGGSTYNYEEIPELWVYHLGGVLFSVIAYFILSKIAGMRLQFGKK